MSSLKDLSGMRFGRLTVIKRKGTVLRGRTVKAPTWECICDCGNIVTVAGSELRSGDTRSCGCLHKELLAQRNSTHGDGHSGSELYRLYRIWCRAKGRCEDPRDTSYADYGGRGITFCEEWHSYEAFKRWALANGYRNNLTIDRIDNDSGYSPDNCRWADYTVQANNRRNCKYITIDGTTKTIMEWCRIFGTNHSTARSRIDRFGWDPAKAVTLPPAKKHFYSNTGG